MLQFILHISKGSRFIFLSDRYFFVFLLHFNNYLTIFPFSDYSFCFSIFICCVYIYRNIQLLSSVEFSLVIEILQNDVVGAFSLNGAWKGAGISALLFPYVHKEVAVLLTELYGKKNTGFQRLSVSLLSMPSFPSCSLQEVYFSSQQT